MHWLASQVYPVVHSGTVVVLKTGFGFLESGDADAKNRVYFAAGEVPVCHVDAADVHPEAVRGPASPRAP